MEKFNFLKDKTLLGLAVVFCALLLTFTAATVTSHKAEALVLPETTACNTPCILIGTYGSAIGVLGANTVAGITQLTTEVSTIITGGYAGMITAFNTQVAEVLWNFYTFFNNLWFGKVLPALKDMNKQSMVMEMDQARVTTSLMDAQAQAELIHDIEREVVNSERERRQGVGPMVAGTMVQGLGRASAFKNNYRNASAKETSSRSSGAAGDAASAGAGADIASRWSRYENNYCRKDYNNGASGCQEDKLLADMDVNVTKTIFGNETIDVTDPDKQRAVDDLIMNIAEPFALPITSSSAVNSVTGQQNILEKESYKARRQTIYDALYHIVGRRAPGSNMGEYVAALRSNSGIPTNAIATNPSYNEIMHAMTNERFRSGQYSLEQIDEPENNKRELVIQQAFMIMQLNDQLELLDRQALILAAQVSDSIRESKATDTAVGGAAIE